MRTIKRSHALLPIGMSLSLIAACGTTAILESHPALASAGERDAAKVYFLRPDIGYRGVMGNAFAISLDGKALLTLAKEEYALVYLTPLSGTVTVESSTVANRGGMNTMTKVQESRPFSFEAGRTYYLAFSENQEGWLSGNGGSYVPVLIDDAAASQAASGLKPVGKAIQEPIPRRE